MLPIIQFDPASLSIFADGPTMSLDHEATNLVDAIICGRASEVSDGLEALSESKHSGRALQLTSAFLHEKRHFLDFVSTNYGAFRVRQFLEIYANLPTILSIGRNMDRLYLPIEVYLDPVRRQVLGVDEPQVEIMQIARNLAAKRKMVEKDRRVFSSRVGSFEIGGEAQLEALAYSAQSRFIGHFGGLDMHQDFSDFVYDRRQFQDKYSAFVTMGVSAGLIPVRHLEALEGRSDDVTHRAHLDLALVECAIFASLQSEYSSSHQSLMPGQIATSYPAERFAALAFHLAQEHKDLCEDTDGLNWRECWDVVDASCETIFGMRIHEQIEKDIEHSEKHLELLRASEDETLIEFSEDYLNLRRSSLDKLIKSPASIASTEYFAVTCGKEVSPTTVIVSSRGEFGDPPDHHTRLMAYDTTDELDAPWRKWWWAASINYRSESVAGGCLAISREKNIHKLIDSYAPTAKLLLNGRKVRTLIGPEVLFAEQRAVTHLGVKFGYYPGFGFPPDEIPEDVLRFITLSDDLICDYSNYVIPKGEATILTPWALRRYPDLARFTIEHLGGTDIAYHTFVKDWTHWAVSKEVMEQLKYLMEREFLFGGLDEAETLSGDLEEPDFSKINIHRNPHPASP